MARARRRSAERRRVVVAGGGMAGMSAALKLVQADFDVTVVEKGPVVGGKFGAVCVGGTPHEHAYHFVTDGCLNFWSVAHDIGLTKPDDFVARGAVYFLRPGPGRSVASRLRRLSHGAVPLTFWDNVHSGVIPPGDMIAYLYSLLDLVTEGGQDRDPDELEFLNRVSVNGFMRSRPYMTDLAALLHQEALLKVFSVPSYETSVRSYRTFVRYFGRDAGGWVLNGDVATKFWRPFVQTLAKGPGPFRCHLGTTIDSVDIDVREGHRVVTRVRVSENGAPRWIDLDYLVLAIPYPDVVRLVEENSRFRQALPELLDLRRLRSRQMASLDLYLTRPLPGIPPEHVTLIDDARFRADPAARAAGRSGARERRRVLAERGDIGSEFGLSFVDNFQAWRPGQRRRETWLNVVASDVDQIAGLSPSEARDAILRALSDYVAFHPQDIDWSRSLLRLNADAPLFTNSVGSWQYRPETRADDASYRERAPYERLTNLCLAGDYCRSKIDVVSLEGATATGIAAARAIAEKCRVPGRVDEPRVPPELSIDACRRAMAEIAPLLTTGPPAPRTRPALSS